MTQTVDAFRLGVDIGGTFTDAILISERTGQVWSEKVLTTPRDPSEGFMSVVGRLLTHSAIDKSSLQSLVHATTVATNAVIERKGARAGLLVTEGFRDILEIARQIRHELYNLQTDKPVPLIPRRHCVEIRERLDYRGEVLTPLDEESVVDAVRKLQHAGVDSIAVCLLHSYRNPIHERRVAEIIHDLHPEAIVSVSSEVAPEIREVLAREYDRDERLHRARREPIHGWHHGQACGGEHPIAAIPDAVERRHHKRRDGQAPPRLPDRVRTGGWSCRRGPFL